MGDKTPATVNVTALKDHTNGGKDYTTGDTYDVDADQVESLVAQGMAKPSAEAKQDGKAATAAEHDTHPHK